MTADDAMPAEHPEEIVLAMATLAIVSGRRPAAYEFRQEPWERETISPVGASDAGAEASVGHAIWRQRASSVDAASTRLSGGRLFACCNSDAGGSEQRDGVCRRSPRRPTPLRSNYARQRNRLHPRAADPRRNPSPGLPRPLRLSPRIPQPQMPHPHTHTCQHRLRRMRTLQLKERAYDLARGVSVRPEARG